MPELDDVSSRQQGHSDRQLNRPRGRGHRGGRQRASFDTTLANAPGVKALRYQGPRTDNRAGWAGEHERLLDGYHASDHSIRREVEERLRDRRGLSLDDVWVYVDEGVVTFVGTVPDRDTKLNLEWIADAVPGVRDIDNRLRVPRH
ncbi:MAG: BON domain-containing protein [Myxococcaceae bacterium]